MQATRRAALSRRAPRLLAVGLGLLGLSLDQATKLLAIDRLQPGQSVDVLGNVLRLNLIRNPGAAFSMGTSFTVGLSLFAVVALVACLAAGLPRIRTMWQGVALGLLMAGISGNLYDRIFREPGPLQGHVVDFLHVPGFAIFNVADICITSAAILVVVLTLLAERDERRARRSEDEKSAA